MRSSRFRGGPARWALVAALFAAPAWAQAPPSPEASDIAACLCLQQDMDVLHAEMGSRQQAYAASQSELATLDAQLQSERARLDVNNQQAAAQFRQLLERRDAVFRRSTALAGGDLQGATERYNAGVNEFNARCANRPRNPDLLRAVQATLVCPRRY